MRADVLQILPLFVLDTMGQVPAFLGLFMAALTGSALSTVSSVINSASALLWQDFLKEFIGHKVAENVAVLINKVLGTVTSTLVCVHFVLCKCIAFHIDIRLDCAVVIMLQYRCCFSYVHWLVCHAVDVSCA